MMSLPHDDDDRIERKNVFSVMLDCIDYPVVTAFDFGFPDIKLKFCVSHHNDILTLINYTSAFNVIMIKSWSCDRHFVQLLQLLSHFFQQHYSWKPRNPQFDFLIVSSSAWSLDFLFFICFPFKKSFCGWLAIRDKTLETSRKRRLRKRKSWYERERDGKHNNCKYGEYLPLFPFIPFFSPDVSHISAVFFLWCFSFFLFSLPMRRV